MTFGADYTNETETAAKSLSCDDSDLSSTTIIANVIRRAGRYMEGATSIRSRIAQLMRDEHDKRRVYEEGLMEGQQMATCNLADVLYAVQSVGLGRAAAIEQSNSHIVVRISECTCCRAGKMGCEFTAGFLAGALLATGRYAFIEAQETTCGDYPGDTCLFHIDLRLKN